MRAPVVVLAVCLVVAPAAAQTSDGRARAKAAFQAAVDAERDKDWQRAIAKFQEAYDILPSADVLYNIGVDLERLEEYRDAATYYRRYLDEKQGAEDQAKVEKQIANLRGRAGTVTITSDPPGAAVRVDDKSYGATPVEVQLSGAHHVVVGDGDSAWTHDVTVEFGEPQKLEASIVAKTGTLTVHSNVDGAQVLVDGTQVGVTPLDVAVTAGSHQLLVQSPTWASYQRTVDVPAEGQAQVTANLVHPLGYVPPPTTPASESSYYVSFAAGVDGSGNAGRVGSLLFGAHRKRTDAALGYTYLDGAAAFQLEVHFELLRGHVRPYVGAALDLGSTSALVATAGFLVNLPAGPHATLGLFAQGAFGPARLVQTGAGTTSNVLIAPITGGVQIAY